jgi:septum formation protein
MENIKIILASASPRRKELLGYIFDEFECIPSDAPEVVPDGISAEETAEFLAVQKARYVGKTHSDALVIGCDTVVILDGEVFGKPCDESDAKRMLTRLSGRTHKVITGVCFYFGGRTVSFSDVTEVEFYDLTEKEIDSYIASGSPMDKAGAYGIQDKGFLPVKSITGDYFNVVGLPAARIKREAEKFMENIAS